MPILEKIVGTEIGLQTTISNPITPRHFANEVRRQQAERELERLNRALQLSCLLCEKEQDSQTPAPC